MELLSFYPDMPRAEGDAVLEGFLAGDLLAVWKTAVRNYSIAITETATPSVRKVLKKQLNSAIDMHAKVFHFMEKTGKYPAYDLEKLLAGDVSLARKALK